MHTLQRLALAALIAMLALFTTATYAQHIFYGDSAEIGNGWVKTWVEVDSASFPVRIAVEFTPGAMNGIRPSQSHRSLNLPPVMADSLWKHVYVNWNPQGHDPIPIYGVPHFDVHFYRITEEQREAIPDRVDPTPVAPQFVPPNYSPGPVPYSVGEMGVHWTDTTSAEFHGHPFTTTMIYGYYQGDFKFLEPMITRAFLQAGPDTLIAIPQPADYQHAGFYPTQYAIRADSDTTITISLENFVPSAEFVPVTEVHSGPLTTFTLWANYPNPFNPSTTIRFDVPQSSPVTLTVYNLLGEEVARLVDGMLPAGAYAVPFTGVSLASGTYLYRLNAGGYVQTRRMVLLK